MTPDNTQVAKQMLASGDHTVTRVAAVLGVSRQSVYRALGLLRLSAVTAGHRKPIKTLCSSSIRTAPARGSR